MADLIRRLTIDLTRRLAHQLNGRIPEGRSRSSDWPRFRRAYLKSYRECFACGRRRAWYRWLDAHHLVPFYAEPDLELEQTNLMPLCRRCHLLIGHLGSWRMANLESSYYASTLRDKIEQWKNRTGSL